MLSLPTLTVLPLPLTGEASRRRAVLGETFPNGGRFVGADAGAVDDDARASAGGAVDHAAVSEKHLFDVRRGRNHGEKDVDIANVGGAFGKRSALGGKRLRLGARPVPDMHRVAGVEQPFRHRRSHASNADPANPVRILVAHQVLMRFARRLRQ